MRRSLLTIVAFAISACVQEGASLATPHVEGPGVTTLQAVEIFNEVCAKTYPRFEKGEGRAQAAEDALKRKNPAKDINIQVYTENLSGLRGCSISYGSAEPIWILKKNLALLGEVKPTSPLTAIVPFRHSADIIEIWIQDTRHNGRIMVHFTLVSGAGANTSVSRALAMHSQ